MKPAYPWLAAIFFHFSIAWVRCADATNDVAQLLAEVEPALVRVEIDLQFDKGEPPTGLLDQDPSPGPNRIHTLAQVVEQERPLESPGYVVGPDEIMTMDANIHPRFIKGIRVIGREGESAATIQSRGRVEWAMLLKLEKPLSGIKPLVFTNGKPAYTASYYRMDGAFQTEAAGFPSRFQKPDRGPVYRSLEHGGVAITSDGKPVGLLFSRRLPGDSSWQVPPREWDMIPEPELQKKIQSLDARAQALFPRVRLSFRSPKNTPAQQQRMRAPRDEDGEGDSTERDVLGMCASDGRIIVLAHLRPTVTSRLQRITVFKPDGSPVTATFEASLKDYGAFVAKLDQPLAETPALFDGSTFDQIGKLLLRADIVLQGENRTAYLHTARIASFRIGPRMFPYPDLPDLSDAWRAHLFDLDGKLVAIPVARREPVSGKGERPRTPGPELTLAKLIFNAVAKLPETGDPANVPVGEADESRLAWLGVELQPMTRDLARANQVSDQTRDGSTGALVTYVHPDSPAGKAGIEPGAVLLPLHVPSRPLPVEVDLDEDEMRSSPFPWERLDEIREQFFDRIPTPWPPAENNFTRALTDVGMGTRYTAELVIDGKSVSREFEVTPGPVHYEAAPRFKSEALGLTVRDLTYDVRRYLQRKSDEPGVVVSKVEPGGKASVAGVKPYELVTHVNEKPVNGIGDFEKLVAAEGDLNLSIKRMAKGRIVTIKGNR